MNKKRERGQYVSMAVNEGAGMVALQVGVVVRAGRRQFTVCWESGQRRQYAQGYGPQLMGWEGWQDDERRVVTDRIFRLCGI